MTATEILADSGDRFWSRRQEDRSRRNGAARRSRLVAPAFRSQGAVAADYPGTADLPFGFEAAEGMRWRHMLRADGWL